MALPLRLAVRTLKREISALSPLSSAPYSSHNETRPSLEEVRQRRLELFEREQRQQLSYIVRVEKISIQVEHELTAGQQVPSSSVAPTAAPSVPPTPVTSARDGSTSLQMNRGLSTPYNCAMHISELLTHRSALALVNGQVWDMHRPLEEDCTLRFLHFKEEDTYDVNKAFWRSCSYILGYIMETAFKDQHYVELCGFPPLSVESMSFVYDADLKLGNWKPTSVELNCLTRIGASLGYQDNRFHRLDVSTKVAKEMFKDNGYKSEQVEQIAARSASGDTVTLYRMGDHVDISRGPMVGSTRFLGRFNVTALHDLDHNVYGPVSRLQGVAIPSQLQLHAWTFNYLCQRAAKLNPSQFHIPPAKTPEPSAEAGGAAPSQ